MFKAIANNSTKVDKIGKVYLKKKVRELLEIESGDRVELLVNDDVDKREALIKVVDDEGGGYIGE